MSLFVATLLTSLFSIILGATLACVRERGRGIIRRLPRSTVAAVICFGGGALWFLYHVSQLGEADFGNIRHWLLILFGGVAFMGFFVARDFLAIRGIAVLVLLSAHQILSATYMQEPLWLLWLVNGYVYVWIVAALYFGTVPYRVRDLIDWLFARSARQMALGGVLAGYGLLLFISALIY